MGAAVNAGIPDAGPPGAGRDGRKAVLVGGGIASMAAAAFMIRDGDMLGRDITILEQLRAIGGSLDGAGSAEGGYVLRGDRMLEGKCPNVFAGHLELSRWVAFTVTLHDPALLRLVRDLTGNVPGEGGLVTFPDGAWLLSIVIPHQPHLIGQPKGVSVLWSYALNMDRPGAFVGKPMPACTGREIMAELLGHLHAEAEAAGILGACTCIPCMMPFITSRFMPRGRGDRPQALPPSTRNLAYTAHAYWTFRGKVQAGAHYH